MATKKQPIRLFMNLIDNKIIYQNNAQSNKYLL